MKAALLAVMLAGCGAEAFSAGSDGGPASDGAGNACEVSIAITPMMPEAGDHVHAAAVVTGLVGVPTYTWHVDGVDSTAYEAPDDSAIGFDVPIAATYTVDVAITGTTSYCSPASQPVDVVAASGATALYRLRVVPPSDVAPLYEDEILVHAGSAATRDVPLDPGEDLPGSVTSGAMGVPAYLEFMPSSGPPIETFSALTGAFDARVALVSYQVLVVPEIAGLAPRAFTWTPSSSASFAVDAGTTIIGSVLAPGGGPLANAQVQLVSGGVPSTIATTAADGSFAVLASFAAGSSASVSVVPPPTSGLARLAATTTLVQPLAITYNAATPCDLSGDAVQRAGVAQPGVQVTIVGTIGVAGIIGGTNATGTVQSGAVTTNVGVLPSLPVPRSAALSIIIQIATSDLAVATIDTSTCAAQTIVAPPLVSSAGVVTVGTTPLAGARVEATPTGTLALATLVPIDATTGADGSFTLGLGSGADYDVRVNDLRGAPFAALDVSAAPASIALGRGLVIEGTVSVLGGEGAVPGAAVELLCASCTGVDADRPIAQAATDVQGHYELAVADPGSM